MPKDKKTDLTPEQIKMVQDTIGRLLQDQEIFLENIKDVEKALRRELKESGADDDDIKAIKNFFKGVEDDLDDAEEAYFFPW